MFAHLVVSIPIRDLMNLNRAPNGGEIFGLSVSIPIRDLMNLNLYLLIGIDTE